MDNKFWQPLDHSIYRFLQLFLQNHSSLNRHFLLAVSGGVDSMVMLTVLTRLANALGVKLSVAHVHHGPSADASTIKYRQKAQACVSERCQQLGLDFLSNSVEQMAELHSEQEFRQWRYHYLFQLCAEKKIDVLLLAHQQEDLIETMMMRLIRGADVQGAVAMRPEQLDPATKVFKLRPFLQTMKTEILAYAQNEKVEFVEDPSNLQTDFFRNWLRHQWLPQLDQFQPGALNSLSRSLLNLQTKILETQGELGSSDLLSGLPRDLWCQEDGHSLISRPVFLTLSREQKFQCLALYMRQCGQSSFTQNHLHEILKHLDKQQNVHTFKTARLDWAMTAEHISAK